MKKLAFAGKCVIYTSVMHTLADFFKFLIARRKFWLLPVAIVLTAIGGLLVVAKGSAIAPFIYTLF